ncbi:TatD family hydrolase [Synoicihabitans lomoniglobus]|uniref:TatD family hydrolase n=1 Tax=Synoicihabitans lomoniglobus TaxID=2909285 RepID=A0AAF0CQX8_9BACT|nr:TatD family hydrolase [Opitutaceae bacterium LMO-M01]WED66398.1 TatD family hydrolase [Opitutaceae bacterium LMO-M01]
MGLIDSHTHLDSFARRGELAATLTEARAADVDTLITVGTGTDDWTIYRDLAREHPGTIYYTAGLHPCAVDETWEAELAALPAFWAPAAGGPLPVALGECGLDRFHLPKNDATRAETVMAWQKAAFAEQLALAKRWDCPVVVHSRGAFDECVELIDASGVNWAHIVFHCFAEGPAEMTVLRERGGYASFTGIITYKNAESVREAARVQGLERLMIETDAPYLTPVPHRGKPNVPAYVRHTADYVADMFAVDYATLAQVTTANARRFYRLPA